MAPISSRYEIIGQLGKGGMGEVRLARLSGLGEFSKLVALKRLRPEFQDQPELVQMLFSEATLAASLDHPNILQVLDVGLENSAVYVVMELLVGQDLAAVLRRAKSRKRELSVSEVLATLLPVCAALDYAHEKIGPMGEPLKLVHRDISPPNIFLTYEGHLKVIDFGIARTSGSIRKTAHGHVRGKVRFMSPEQSRGEPLDGRSDIFAVGLVAYLMLAGEHPYGEGSGIDVLARITRDAAPPLQTRCPLVPKELAEIVDGTLRRERELRPRSARELRKQLYDFAVGQRLEVSPMVTEALLEELFEEELEQRQAAREDGKETGKYLSDARPLSAAARLRLTGGTAPTKSRAPNTATTANVVSQLGATTRVEIGARSATESEATSRTEVSGAIDQRALIAQRPRHALVIMATAGIVGAAAAILLVGTSTNATGRALTTSTPSPPAPPTAEGTDVTSWLSPAASPATLSSSPRSASPSVPVSPPRVPHRLFTSAVASEKIAASAAPAALSAATTSLAAARPTSSLDGVLPPAE